MISAVMKGDLRYYRILFINCRVPIYRLHCIAVAGASKHFTAEASPCIDIRSHQAKSSTKLLNETVYSTRVSTFIIFVIQCVNNSMYCDFIYFLYCIHHRNCTFPCSACRHRSQITDPRSSLQQQGIETKKASKTESCGKSSEEHCGVRTNKKNWNFQKYVFDINIYKHWVGKQSEPRPLLQRRPANPGGYRISQNLTESQWKKWIENVEPRPGVTWLNSSDHPTSQVPGPGTSQIFPVSTRWIRLTQHRSSLGMDHNDSAGRWLNESMHLYSSLKHCDILWSCDYYLGRVIEWRKHDESWRIQWIKRWIQRIHPRSSRPSAWVSTLQKPLASERFPPSHPLPWRKSARSSWPPARSLCRDLLLFRPDRPRGTWWIWVCCAGSAQASPPRRNGPAYFLQVCAWWLPGCSGASASIEFSGLQTGTCPSLSASRHSAQPPEWQTQTWCPVSPSEPTLWAPPHCTPAVRGLDSEMWTSLALPMVLSHFTMFYPSHLGCALLSTFSVL